VDGSSSQRGATVCSFRGGGFLQAASHRTLLAGELRRGANSWPDGQGLPVISGGVEQKIASVEPAAWWTAVRDNLGWYMQSSDTARGI
jgi:hypothetical protein